MNLVRSVVAAVGRAVGVILRREPLLCAPETKAARIELCEACDSFDEGTRRCRECGCFADIKAALNTEQCSRRIWERVIGTN